MGDRPIGYKTVCKLQVQVKSSGNGESQNEATGNGGVFFLSGSREMLFIGIHPERGKLAVRNRVFRRGTLEQGYRWVSVRYPWEGPNGKRNYTLQFTPSAFILKCDRLLGQDEVSQITMTDVGF